ncbi:MAG: polysaccharide deacetylase family protein [bacterium]
MKSFLKKFIIIIVILFLGAVKVFALDSAPVSSPEKIIYQVPIFVYHSLGPIKIKKESAIQLHYRVTSDVFEMQMKYLKDNGYNPISFSTYVNSLTNNTELPNKAMVLTFDDGWKTQYKYAVPILEKYGFTATFFIVSDYASLNYGAFMNIDELKVLIANGFDIGSHTKTHPVLSRISSEKAVIELTESKKTLEDALGIKITTLAYPYYVSGKTIRDLAESAGYSGARAGLSKFKNSIDRIYELKSREVVNNPNPFLSKRLPDF